MEVRFQVYFDIKIIRKDGTSYDLSKLGYRVKNFDYPSANYNHTLQSVSTFGSTLVDTKTSETTLNLSLRIFASNNFELELKRVELNRIFSSYETFYIISGRLPYLRWEVVAQPFTMPQLANSSFADVSINLTCPGGYAESVGTTQDEFNYFYGVWGMANGLPNAADLKYSFQNNTNFKVFNASVIPLKADERPVTIRFTGTVLNKLTITNKTTNQVFIYNTKIEPTDVFYLKGLIPIKNDSQDYWASNHGYIDLVPGWNEFTIAGASDFKIDFITRFYY